MQTLQEVLSNREVNGYTSLFHGLVTNRNRVSVDLKLLRIQETLVSKVTRELKMSARKS